MLKFPYSSNSLLTKVAYLPTNLVRPFKVASGLGEALASH